MTLWAVEKPNFQLHPFAGFVWSTSHLPSFCWISDIGVAFWTLRHNQFSFHAIVQYAWLSNKNFIFFARAF
jgi:hypothetical protein